jgi:hypothetical protein
MATNSDDEWTPPATVTAPKQDAAAAAVEALKSAFVFQSTAPRQGAFDDDVYDDGGEDFWDEYIDPDDLQAGKGVFSTRGNWWAARYFVAFQILASN